MGYILFSLSFTVSSFFSCTTFPSFNSRSVLIYFTYKTKLILSYFCSSVIIAPQDSEDLLFSWECVSLSVSCAHRDLRVSVLLLFRLPAIRECLRPDYCEVRGSAWEMRVLSAATVNKGRPTDTPGREEF